MFTKATMLAAGIGLFAGGVLAAGTAQAAPADLPNFHTQQACLQDVARNDAQSTHTCQRLRNGAWQPVRKSVSGNKIGSDNEFNTTYDVDASNNEYYDESENTNNMSKAETGDVNVKTGDVTQNMYVPETGMMGSFGNGLDQAGKLIGGGNKKGGGLGDLLTPFLGGGGGLFDRQ
ncbi:hypothetical protein FB565_004131 [Actinoplanes lutulentus]|uniref:Uncharacterized protein n=1 Tax=Actinoplanes lutulentus TaxID=1287878 RepID=A0A327ZK35_9ACTN|nr:hypothetical protein [Actinoplanes lutulentus]MBB2944402.1 hypothetical protein [Actinoplanes lutulentus]RAK42366.1 hypothetical protein B0I29_102191 [Actinoplanes lutulentus]